jgi:hypothetical protein
MMSDRNNAKRYVFGAALASAAMGGIPGLLRHAQAQTVNADFTFEAASVSSISGAHAGTFGSYVADSGTGTFFASHTGSSTYSEPTGNNSAKSLSTTAWAVGDYYEFDVPTTGIQNIVISFDQASSATGPGAFELVAIIGTYSIFSGSTSVSSNGSTVTGQGSAFASGGNTNVSHGFSLTNFSNSTAFDNNSSVAFRLLMYANLNLAETGTVGAAGTDRVDNFLVTGDAVTSTPEPASIALAGIGVAGLLLRRKPRFSR